MRRKAMNKKNFDKYLPFFKSIMDCHNAESQEKMKKVIEWFDASPEHNIVYTFYNEKQNKDVYMVALRDGEKLIGYYEKHEFRNREKDMIMYDLT